MLVLCLFSDELSGVNSFNDRWDDTNTAAGRLCSGQVQLRFRKTSRQACREKEDRIAAQRLYAC